MDSERVGTPQSQQQFVPMRELDHSAPEVYQHPAPEVYHQPAAIPVQHHNYPPQPYPKDLEKPVFSSPLAHNAYPVVGGQQGQPYWVPPEFQGVPPQYTPGTPTGYPTALEVPPVPPPKSDEGKICGIRRGLFLLLLGLGGLVLLGVAVGVGVGVGVGNQPSSSSEKTSPSSGANNGTSTASSAAPTVTVAGSSCPGISSTQYTASNGKKFLHLCGLDYSGYDEGTDIEHVISQNFAECMESCAQLEECTGAGWGPPTDTNKARGTCWMKKNLKKSHEATPDWNFGVLIDGSAVPTSLSNGTYTSTKTSSASSTPTPTS